MKVKNEDRKVGRHGTSNEQNFFIDGSAAMFKLLSDKLYSDKVTAVIRELACNAKDAHVDAGRGDVPFEVHLPNALEPWFAMTDFGIGLSNDEILDMYTGYGKSTKTNSNKVTGCFGVGSKSPFAYTDSFTVESRWNGTLTVFSCFYNEEGIPTIAIMGDEDGVPTDEHNGLTVKMAVKENDMREFASKASAALDRFDPAPIVTGNTDYKIATRKYMVEGTSWKMLEHESNYGEGIHAIQGNVVYPILKRSLGDLTPTQSAVMELSIDFIFDIGELDVAANREALGYDETTIANIKERLDVVSSEISPLFQDKFKNCKTLWEARVLFKEVINPLSYGLTKILSDNDVGLKWKKQNLSDSFKINRDLFDDISIVLFQKNSRGGRGQTADWGYNGTITFGASSNILFFYDDIGHGSHSRLTHFMETHSNSVRYQYLFKTDNKKLLKKISKALGNVTLQPVSNLEKRPKAIRQARRVTSKVLEYTGRSYDRRDSWNPTELDLEDGGIYVMINRFKVYDDNNGYETEMNHFDEIVELAKAHSIVDLTDKAIYGIRKGHVATMKDDSGWVNLFDLIRDKLAVVVKKEKVSQIMADRDAYRDFFCNILSFLEGLDHSKLEKDSAISTFLKANDYMKNQDSEMAKSISEVARKVNFELKSGSAKYDLEELWKSVKTRYPLIKLINDEDLRGGYYSNDGFKEGNCAALKAYIEMVDVTIAAESKTKTLTLKAA